MKVACILPKNKLQRLCELLREWSHKQACTKRELLSLVGLLHHAATVVKPGWMFVRQLIDLSAILKELHFHIRLNKDARSDIWWWVRFIERWNSQGSLAAVGHLLPSVTVQSDASGGWGCSAVWGELWLPVQWPASWADVSIAPKELALIVFAALVFGRDLQNYHVLFQSDNSTVVAALQRGMCQDPHVMQLLRMLHFVAAHYSLLLRQHTCQAGVTRSRMLYLATRLTQVLLCRRSCLRFPIPSHQASSTWCAIWRWTGHQTIGTIGCALAWSRYSYVNGPVVSSGLCTVSEVLR